MINQTYICYIFYDILKNAAKVRHFFESRKLFCLKLIIFVFFRQKGEYMCILGN